MRENSIIRTDEDYLRAHVTLLRNDLPAARTTPRDVPAPGQVSAGVTSKKPVFSGDRRLAKAAPFPIRRTVVPADSRRPVWLPSLRRSTALGKSDALDRVELREGSALGSGYHAAVASSVVSVTAFDAAHCFGAPSQLPMNNDNAELQMKP